MHTRILLILLLLLICHMLTSTRTKLPFEAQNNTITNICTIDTIIHNHILNSIVSSATTQKEAIASLLKPSSPHLHNVYITVIGDRTPYLYTNMAAQCNVYIINVNTAILHDRSIYKKINTYIYYNISHGK